METKEVYLYDDSNNPLRVSGITLELFDSNSGCLIAKEVSKNRDPHLGLLSNNWGADLSFSPISAPVDILITDATFQYPGNSMHSLNGQTTDRLDIDLFQIPTAPFSKPPPANSTPTTIIASAQTEENWNTREKLAVTNLVLNYTRIVAANALNSSSTELTHDLKRVIKNWDDALHNLGIDAINMESTAGVVAWSS